MRHTNWRDCKAWKDEGLPLSTTSDEAAKLYDACLTQFYGWFDDTQLGGIAKSLELMYNADPDFVLGSALSLGLALAGTTDSIQTSQGLKSTFEALKSKLEKLRKSLTQREIMHVEGVLLWAEGKMSLAGKIWEEILLDYPTDPHALKMVDMLYFYLGNFNQLRDSVARVLPVWEAKRPPLKSYVYGMYAFGLEETLQFQKAESYARKALEELPADGWATHSLAHVFEMEGRISEGLQFMNSTVKNWEFSNQLACHNHWHVALYHFENENYGSVIETLEKEILPRVMSSKTILDIVDFSSLLWRLNLVNPSSVKKSYWDQVSELCEPYSKQNISTFNDSHFMMAYAGCGKQNNIDELLESLSGRGNIMESANNSSITRPLLESIANFRDEKFEKVVELLEPIRHDLMPIGGSGAQRDVFNLMLIVSALKSNIPRHRKLARAVIHEREGFKSTPLNTKLCKWAI